MWKVFGRLPATQSAWTRRKTTSTRSKTPAKDQPVAKCETQKGPGRG